MVNHKLVKDNVLKIDLDMKSKDRVIKKIVYGLIFLQDIKMVYLQEIKTISLIKKNSYSVKIKLNKKIKPVSIIIIQAILGDDNKRIGICYRDLLLNIENWNRLFNIKRYPDGEIIESEDVDITNLIFNRIGKIKNEI